MISIIDSYLARVLVATTGISLSVLVGLSGLIQFVEQLKHVGKGTYSTLDAGLYVLFSLPHEVEVFFPMAVLLGGLIGLGVLASNSELIVMQAAGMSKFDIVRSAMKSAIVMMITVMLVGEFMSPKSEAFANELRTRAISGGSVFMADAGVWAKDGSSFIYINTIEAKDLLKDVIIYEFDDELNLKEITTAKQAKYLNGVWNLRFATETQFSDDKIKVNEGLFMGWDSSLSPDKLSSVSKPESLSISGLWTYLDYLKNNEQDSRKYELALWRKILQPVTVVVMLLLALSFVFGPLRSASMGARILLGVIAGFSFHIANEVFGPMSLVYQLPPAVGAFLPSLVFTLLAIHWLRKA